MKGSRRSFSGTSGAGSAAALGRGTRSDDSLARRALLEAAGAPA